MALEDSGNQGKRICLLAALTPADRALWLLTSRNCPSNCDCFSRSGLIAMVLYFLICGLLAWYFPKAWTNSVALLKGHSSVSRRDAADAALLVGERERSSPTLAVTLACAPGAMSESLLLSGKRRPKTSMAVVAERLLTAQQA